MKRRHEFAIAREWDHPFLRALGDERRSIDAGLLGSYEQRDLDRITLSFGVLLAPRLRTTRDCRDFQSGSDNSVGWSRRLAQRDVATRCPDPDERHLARCQRA